MIKAMNSPQADPDRVCEECSASACSHCDVCGAEAPIVFACGLCHCQLCDVCDRRDGHPEAGRCWCEYDDGSLEREKLS